MFEGRYSRAIEARRVLTGVLACMAVVLSLSLPLACQAAESSSDILPPVITIISPQPNSVLTSPSRVTIELEYADSGSGVDPQTGYLFVNGVNVTPELEADDEGATCTLTGLRQGAYSIRFGVSDMAGNSQEIAWAFEVRGIVEAVGFSGKSDLRYDWEPLRKITEVLDFTVTADVMGYDVVGRSRFKLTDYPGGQPLYSSARWNFYLDNWSLVVSQDSHSLSVGDIETPAYMELVGVSRQMRGAAGSARLSSPGTLGTLDNVRVQIFSGRVARSVGLGITVMDIAGVRAECRESGGASFTGTYMSLGQSNGYDIVSLSGRGVLRQVVSSAEITYGLDRGSGVSGFGIAAHADTSLGATHVGADLQLIEQNYPSLIAPPWLSSANGGALGVSLRTTTRLGTSSTLRFDGALVRDNLAGRGATSSEKVNASVRYQYRVAQGWTLSADHGYQRKIVSGGVGSGEDSISRSYRVSADGRISVRGLELPSKGSITVKDSINAATLKETESQTLALSTTVPAWGKQLTPALTWSKVKNSAGTTTESVDLRLGSVRLSLPLNVDAVVSFSAKETFRLPEGALVPDKTTTEAEADISLSRRVFTNSIASLEAQITNWSNSEAVTTSGWDQSISIRVTTSF